MKKSKVAAITIGIIASCLFGSYMIADASTVTLDDSTTGTPENPKPISTTKTNKIVSAKTSIKTSPTGIKKTAIKIRNKKLAVAPEKDTPTEKVVTKTVSTTAPVEDSKNIETQTTTTTRIFVKSISTSSEPKKSVSQNSENPEIVTMPVITTAPTEIIEPVTEPTEPEIIEEVTITEQPVQTTAEISTTPATTTSVETTKKAKPKATTKAETTPKKKTTTTASTTSTTKATTTTTTTTTTTSTTTTTTTTSEETTTTTTTTPEPIITTVETVVTIPVIQDSEIIDVSEIYLDDILGSGFTETSMTVEEMIPEEIPEMIPEEAPEIILEEISEIIPELDESEEIIAIVDTSRSVSDSDYILLCNAVAHEAGSDVITIENKAKVVEVIMNRVDSANFPNTIYAVITQKSQFSGSSSYANLGTYSSKVTQNVKSAVDLYLSDPSAYNHGYLYFYGDGSQNHFSQY